MHEFTQQHVEKWLSEFTEKMPLNCANAEKFNIMCEAMRNMNHIHREFTEEDAKKWVEGMTPPARWTMEQTTTVMNQYGYHHRPCEFWAVMNAMYSDYGKTMEKYGIDNANVWADLAHDFITDEDSVKDKVGKYWRDIVRH